VGLSVLYRGALGPVSAIDIIAHRALWAVPFCALLLLAVCWFSEPVTISRAWTFALVWSGLALYLGHLLHRRRRWNPPLLMRLY
jgi:EamA domain-containing membrane protein RarD